MLAVALSNPQWALLLIAAFAAGLFDSIVGGGGLILVPALLAVLPTQPTALISGTNKLAAFWGTSSAAVVYNRKVRINRKEAATMAACGAAGSVLGALIATRVHSDVLKPMVVAALIAVFVYVVRNPTAGIANKELLHGSARPATMLSGGFAIGLYDGFVGPGTGSFLVFLLVGAIGFAFLEASAIAKIVNTATNVAAIAWYASHDRVLVGLGLAMGAANLAGSQIGSRLAIAKGSAWIRKIFLIIVSALMIKVSFDVIHFLRKP